MRESLSKITDCQKILECQGLEKAFGRIRALDGLHLAVGWGSIHGFLGPNGAGKTTTMRAVLGQIRLDAGRVRVFGLDPLADVVDVHRRLAYVPGDTVLWPNLTGGECIDLLGRLHGRQDVRRRDELVERFELDPTRKTRGYSKGNRQKVALVAALSCHADLLLLDEPTSGLDPVMAERFVRTVREERDAGAAVLLSSHIMSEVESLCDTVAVVRAGRTVYSGTLDELRGTADVRIEARGGDGRELVREVAPERVDAELSALLATGATVVSVGRPGLERVFLDFYEEAV